MEPIPNQFLQDLMNFEPQNSFFIEPIDNIYQKPILFDTNIVEEPFMKLVGSFMERPNFEPSLKGPKDFGNFQRYRSDFQPMFTGTERLRTEQFFLTFSFFE